MNYKLRKNFTTDPDYALEEILEDRKVENVENFLHPTKDCELDPFLLDNMREGVEMLKRHLDNGSKILVVVDSD